jgi:predicted ATPase
VASWRPRDRGGHRLAAYDGPRDARDRQRSNQAIATGFFYGSELRFLGHLHGVNLRLERGNCDGSCFAFVTLARIAGPRFGDCQTGFRFGQLGYDLVGQRGSTRFQASTYREYSAFVMRWMSHVRSCRNMVHHAFEAANKNGDLTVATYCSTHLNADLLVAGDPLREVQREAEHGLAFAQKAQFGLVIDLITTQLILIQTLRGLTPRLGCFDGGQIDPQAGRPAGFQYDGARPRQKAAEQPYR